MRERRKLILPGINLALAAALLAAGYTRPIREWSPVPWEIALCFSINAPANLLRALVSFEWEKHMYPHCSVANSETCIRFERGLETAMFLFGVAFIWYVVALEIEATSRGTRAMARYGFPARILADVVLFSAGSLFVILFLGNWRTWQQLFRSWADLGTFLYLAWALTLAIFYGRDLTRCFYRRG